MTVSNLVRKLNVVAFCACGLAAQHPSLSVASVDVGAAQAPARERQGRDAHLVTASAIGQVRLNMTLDEARRTLTAASFARVSDGDGAALVELRLGKDDSLILWADEDDPAAPIDWSKKIVTIEAFSQVFHTREGVHPGSLVRDVARLFGPVHEIIKSEIEGRQYITFERQPQGLTFRVDYTGIFMPGTRRTTRFEPRAKIFSIAITSLS